ncbi:MAG: hypothetical protein AAF733_09755, partial [Verrucomicrobiota bacterium]
MEGETFPAPRGTRTVKNRKAGLCSTALNANVTLRADHAEAKRLLNLATHSMESEERPETTRPLFDVLPPSPEIKQEIADRKGEAKRIVKRLAAIVEDHRQSALHLDIEIGAREISLVISA